MKTKRILVWIGIGGGGAAVMLAIAVYVLLIRDASGGLGLTQLELNLGGSPDVETLRAKAKAVADAYLSEHETGLKELCGGPFQLTPDSSLSPKARALGYRSSFYYYCWDIYLPYSLRPDTGGQYTVLVQLSDATAGHQHDLDKFRVLRTTVLDQQGLTTKTLK